MYIPSARNSAPQSLHHLAQCLAYDAYVNDIAQRQRWREDDHLQHLQGQGEKQRHAGLPRRNSSALMVKCRRIFLMNSRTQKIESYCRCYDICKKNACGKCMELNTLTTIGL